MSHRSIKLEETFAVVVQPLSSVQLFATPWAVAQLPSESSPPSYPPSSLHRDSLRKTRLFFKEKWLSSLMTSESKQPGQRRTYTDISPDKEPTS